MVIDADAQANASICLAGDERLASLISYGLTIDAYLVDLLLGEKKRNFADYIYYQASNVSHGGNPLQISLLASSSELRLLERELIFELTKKGYGLDAIVGRLFKIMKGSTRSNEKGLRLCCYRLCSGYFGRNGGEHTAR